MMVEPCYQWQKCRPVTVVSDGIRFMQIFVGVLWGGGIKDGGMSIMGIFSVFCWLFLETRDKASIII